MFSLVERTKTILQTNKQESYLLNDIGFGCFLKWWHLEMCKLPIVSQKNGDFLP